MQLINGVPGVVFRDNFIYIDRFTSLFTLLTADRIMSRHQLRAYLTLARPINVLITMGAVGLGGWMAGLRSFDGLLAGAMLAAGLVCAGANAHNDYIDRNLDKLAHPARPLPAGILSPTAAIIFWLVACASAFAIGQWLTASMAALVSAAMILLWWYNRYGKSIPLLGNVVVGLCGGLAVILGAAAGGDARIGLIPAAFALVIHVARELVKDTEDLSGDRIVGIRTFPAVFGIRATQILTASLLLLVTVGLAAPWMWAGYSTTYLVTAAVFAGIPCLYVGVTFLRNAEQNQAHRLSQILKAAMVAGMLAIALL
jgi:geranylgeranylglycerol-phosphate geranylgeranyltransferase